MKEIDTAQCKEFLVALYPESKKSEWKRVRKYKDEEQVVCRDFTHPALGVVTLQEKNGTLLVKGSTEVAPQVSPQETLEDDSCMMAYAPVFSKEEMRLVKKHSAFFGWENYERDEELYEDESYIEGVVNSLGRALPRCFTFDFSDDLQDHGKKITLTSRVGEISLRVCPVSDPYFDQHVEYVARFFLPEGFHEDMETFFTIGQQEDVAQKSVLWLYKKLVNLGMTPNPESELLPKLVKNIKTVALNEVQENIKESDEANQYFTAIKKGDAVQVKNWLNGGLSPNTVLKNKNNLAVTAINSKSWDVLKELMDHPEFDGKLVSMDKRHESLISACLEKLYMADNNSEQAKILACIDTLMVRFANDLTTVFPKKYEDSEASCDAHNIIFNYLCNFPAAKQFVLETTVEKLSRLLSEQDFTELSQKVLLDNFHLVNLSTPKSVEIFEKVFHHDSTKFKDSMFWQDLVDGLNGSLTMMGRLKDEMHLNFLNNTDRLLGLVGRDVNNIMIDSKTLEGYLRKKIIDYSYNSMKNNRGFIMVDEDGLTQDQKASKACSQILQLVLKHGSPPRMKM